MKTTVDTRPSVKVQKLKSQAELPEYQSEQASGFDLHSLTTEVIRPNETKLIPTGLAMSIPDGFEAQVRPRSGLSLDTGLRVANSPGTIDSDYRGEIKVIIHNSGNKAHQINEGDRIAQCVIVPVVQANLEEVEDLDETTRGKGGFGSTGSS